MKRQVELYDFRAFGQAIKIARMQRGISRNELGDIINIDPRYIASIENSGQHPSLKIFYELVTFFGISVDQFFFPNKNNQVNTQRRQLDALIDDMDGSELTILTTIAKGIKEAEQDNSSKYLYVKCIIIRKDNDAFQLLNFSSL